MDLYPSIDVRDGRCVRLHQGRFDAETVYDDDPVAVACGFAKAGASWIHVVDLDAARRSGHNHEVVAAIVGAVREVAPSTRVQAGGGVLDGSLLDAGVERVVVGSAAIEAPELFLDLVGQYPARVALGLDHWQGEVRIRGWEAGSGRPLAEVLAQLAVPGVGAVIVTDITRDGTLTGPDLDGLRAVVGATSVPVIASGGVSSLEDLRALAAIPVAGAITGKAIYEGRFTVEEAIAACAPSA